MQSDYTPSAEREPISPTPEIEMVRRRQNVVYIGMEAILTALSQGMELTMEAIETHLLSELTEAEPPIVEVPMSQEVVDANITHMEHEFGRPAVKFVGQHERITAERQAVNDAYPTTSESSDNSLGLEYEDMPHV